MVAVRHPPIITPLPHGPHPEQRMPECRLASRSIQECVCAQKEWEEEKKRSPESVDSCLSALLSLPPTASVKVRVKEGERGDTTGCLSQREKRAGPWLASLITGMRGMTRKGKEQNLYRNTEKTFKQWGSVWESRPLQLPADKLNTLSLLSHFD